MSFVHRLDTVALRSSRPVVAVRVALARRPWWRAIVVITLAVLAGWAHLDAVDDVRHERAAWGSTVDVWVADDAHTPGDAVDAGRVAVPAAVVPGAAVRTDPTGRVARQHLAGGEIVVDADLAPSSSPIALAPADSVVVPVADPLVADAAIGAAVMVTSEGIVLAASGIVVDVVDGVVLVAVVEREAPMVAAAASRSMASLLFPAEPYGASPP